MVPALSSLSRSYSIFLLQSIQYWSGFIWKIRVAVGSTWIWPLPLVEFQAPPRTAEHVCAKSPPVAYCVTKVV